MSAQEQHLLPAAHEPKLIEPPHAPKPERRPGWLGRHPWLVALAILILLAAIFLVGYLPRRSRDKMVAENAAKEANALPPANATQVQRSPAVSKLLLPGSTAAFEEAYIYARATGYIRRRYADIGDRVVKGQLLADVDAPDLDAQVSQGRAMVDQAVEQLAQAQASLENAQAAEDLARVTWERYKVLVQDGAVSRQDADQQLANYRTAQANTKLQQAGIRNASQNIRSMKDNLERLIALQSFEQVRAPFAGVITARNFDVGALVSSSGSSQGASTTPLGGTQAAGSSANAGVSGSSTQLSAQGPTASNPTTPGIGSSGELYRLASIDVMRVLVAVPQENAPTVRPGQQAEVFVTQVAGHIFHGKVARTASELDPTARTLLTEVDVQNVPALLLPGMYTQVRFSDARPSPPLLVPGDSVMETANGMEVAVLEDLTEQQREQLRKKIEEAGKDQALRQQAEKQAAEAKRVHIQKVEVGRDYGTEMEVTAGLKGWEYLVVNPGDAVREGGLVMPRPAPDVAGQGGNSQQKGPAEAQPGSFGSPSMTAPTQQKNSGSGQKGSQKGGGGGKK